MARPPIEQKEVTGATIPDSYLEYEHRSYGMDHDRYDWSLLTKRKPVKWPNGARVALWVNVAFEFFPFEYAGQALQSARRHGHLLSRHTPLLAARLRQPRWHFPRDGRAGCGGNFQGHGRVQLDRRASIPVLDGSGHRTWLGSYGQWRRHGQAPLFRPRCRPGEGSSQGITLDVTRDVRAARQRVALSRALRIMGYARLHCRRGR